MRPLILVAAALLTFPAMASGQQTGDQGSVLCNRKGCRGGHGASGRGGAVPRLAKTKLSAAAVPKQLGAPRAIVPPFPEEVVNDAEARAILTYLQALAPVPPKLRADVPRGVLDQKTCAECHRKFHPTIVAQFEQSAMGRPGVQNPRVKFQRSQITCAACHGTNHDDIMASKGRVSETICAACHQQIYKEHVLDAGHSYGPGPGKLGINWERNIGVPHYKQMPRKVMEVGCDACHAQAGATDDQYWSDEQKKYVDT